MKRFKFLMVLGVCACSVATTVRADTASDNAAQAVARAALLVQLNAGVSTNKPATPAMPAAAPVPVPVPAPKPVVVVPAVTAPAVIVVTNPVPVMPAPPVVNTTATMPAPSIKKTVIITAAPGAPDTKETRLGVLSAKYKANQISPLDYFTQREALMKGE
ncbi:MAG TPA: hypothetical protein VGO57_11635 [Verrucomicrobiae bacterium]|jgi:hypothetical protein